MDAFQREFLRLVYLDYPDLKGTSFEGVIDHLNFGEQLKYTELVSAPATQVWETSLFRQFGLDVTVLILVSVNNHTLEALTWADPYLRANRLKILDRVALSRHGKRWLNFKKQFSDSPLFGKRPIQALQVFEIVHLLNKSEQQKIIVQLGNGDAGDAIRVVVLIDDVGIYGFSVKTAKILEKLAKMDKEDRFTYEPPVAGSEESYVLLVTEDLALALMLLFEISPHIRVKKIVPPTDGLYRQEWADITSRCVQCLQPATHVCARCEKVAYCGKTCQIADWKKKHQNICK